MRSDKNARKDTLQQTVKATNTGSQTVTQKESFAENESVVKTVHEEHQDTDTEKVVYSRFLL